MVNALQGGPGQTTSEVWILAVPNSAELVDGEQWLLHGPYPVLGPRPCRRQNHSVVWLTSDKILVFVSCVSLTCAAKSTSNPIARAQGGCTAMPYDEELGDTWLLHLDTKLMAQGDADADSGSAMATDNTHGGEQQLEEDAEEQDDDDDDDDEEWEGSD